MIRFACPKCQTGLQAAAEQAGAVVACPRCQTQVRLPSPQVAGPPAVPASRPAPAAAPAPWYYSRGGERHGPFTAAQLKQLAQTGELQPTDSVWKEGMPNWKQASEIKGLFSTTQAAQRKARKGPPPLPLAENGGGAFERLAESAGHPQEVPAATALKSGGLLGSPLKLALIGAAVAVPLLVVAAVGVFLAVRSGSGTGTKADSQPAGTQEATSPKDKDREKGPAGGYAARAFKATGKQPPKDFKPSPPGSTDDFLDALEILGLRPGNKFDTKPFAWIPIRGRGVTEALWVEVFGRPQRLSDGYDTLGKSRIAYQRWKHDLTDGPVTIHGNIVTHDGTTEYLPVKVCLY